MVDIYGPFEEVVKKYKANPDLILNINLEDYDDNTLKRSRLLDIFGNIIYHLSNQDIQMIDVFIKLALHGECPFTLKYDLIGFLVYNTLDSNRDYALRKIIGEKCDASFCSNDAHKDMYDTIVNEQIEVRNKMQQFNQKFYKN